MLAPSIDTIRLVLHLLGVAVWVGGQIVVGAIVPVVRRSHPEATRAIARGFSYAAWPGFALAVLTGLWSLAVVDVAATSTEYQVTLLVKIMLVMTSGAAAFVHQIGTTKLAMAVGGAVALLAALAALVLGQTLTA